MMKTTPSRHRRTALVVLVAFVAMGTAAFGQSPASEFGQLPTRVRPGDTVYVTDAAGREHKGMLFDLSPTVLVVESHGRREPFSPDQVRGVSWMRPDPLRNGALIGLGVGAGLAALLVAAVCAEEGGCGPEMAIGVLVYAGIGAGIGTGVDALIPGKKILVYQPASRQPGLTLSLSPILRPRRQGVAATIHF